MTSDIFVLDRPSGHGLQASYVQEAPVLQGDAPVCNRCGKYTALRPWVAPHFASLERVGPGWADLCFGTADEILVSERLATLARHADLAGLEERSLLNVNRYDRAHGNPAPPRYQVVRVKHSGVAVDRDASELLYERNRVCTACGIGEGEWTSRRVVLQGGHTATPDLFFARGLPGIYLASERFVRLLHDHGLTGVRAIPASEFPVRLI